MEERRYDLFERLGEGGMGQVFRGRVLGAHGFYKTVAIKRLRRELTGDLEVLVRFVSEAKLSERLSHTHIVQILDLARTADQLYLIYGVCPGRRSQAAARGAAASRSTALRRALRPPRRRGPRGVGARARAARRGRATGGRHPLRSPPRPPARLLRGRSEDRP